MDDSVLLRDYTDHRSDDAFAELVTRHINLVYSVAMRAVGDPHAAEEITQAVFIILARKASQLRSDKALSSWLFQVTRLTANNYWRTEMRRHRREQEVYMQTLLDTPEPDVWRMVAPLLDDAVGSLNEVDRRAILLRFYEGKNLAEIGAALGASETAAEKRVSRAVEKLQRSFSRRGMTSTAEALAKAVVAHSVQVAPAALAPAATALALAKGATASVSTLTLIEGALKAIAWTKVKTAVTVGVAALLIAGTAATITIAARSIHKDSRPYDAWEQISNLSYQVGEVIRSQNETMQQQQRPLSAAEMGKNHADISIVYTNFFKKAPPGVVIRPTHFPDRKGGFAQFSDNNIIGTAVSMSTLMGIAFGTNNDLFSTARIVLPPGAPAGEFDYLINAPDHGRELFRAEIERQFRLVGYRETRETNVLVLTIKDRNAPNLRPGSPAPEPDPATSYNVFATTRELAARLEKDFLHQPVIDGAGLDKAHEISSEADHWFSLPWRQDDMDLLKEELLDRSGLALMTTNMPIEMLVVNDYPGDWIWDFNSTTLGRVPPLLILRPTQHPTWVPGEMFGTNRYLSIGRTPKELIASIYSQIDSRAKITFPADLPDGKFDCIVTLESTNWWSSLQSEINQRFNLAEELQSSPTGPVVVVRNAR